MEQIEIRIDVPPPQKKRPSSRILVGSLCAGIFAACMTLVATYSEQEESESHTQEKPRIVIGNDNFVYFSINGQDYRSNRWIPQGMQIGEIEEAGDGFTIDGSFMFFEREVSITREEFERFAATIEDREGFESVHTTITYTMEETEQSMALTIHPLALSIEEAQTSTMMALRE